jgi:hypothetical protein
MKMKDRMLITSLALGMTAWTATAQDQGGPPQPGNRPPRGEAGGPGGPGGGGQRFVPPIVAALDANGDSVIDEKEIENATAALKKLDKNGDGKLTREEFMGMRPGGPGGPGMRGPGGPGGEGRRGGPGGEGGPQRPPLEQ